MRVAVACAVLLCGMLLGAGRARAQPDAPDVPTIILYTIGMGDDPFERFGHTTVCVRYMRHMRDNTCYDYGAADFKHVGKTAWLFLTGGPSFFLESDRERAVVQSYRAADRTIWRQILPLTDEQALRIGARLTADYDNRQSHYAYRLLDDNCSTRVRDLFDAGLGGALRAATAGKPGAALTYRDYGRRGYADMPIGLLVLDLFLTDHADRVPDRWAQMFMPESLRDEVAALLGVEPEVVYEHKGPPFATDPKYGAREWLVLTGFVLALPLALARRFGRLPRVVLAWSAFWLALFGIILWLVPALSPFVEQRHNVLMLVFTPLDAALPFLREPTRRNYARTRLLGLAIVALLGLFGLFKQPLLAPVVLVALPMLAVGFIRVPKRRPSTPPPHGAPGAEPPARAAA